MPIDTLRIIVVGLAAYVAVMGTVLFFVRRHGIEVLIVSIAVNLLLFYAERQFGDLSAYQLNKWATWIQVHQAAFMTFYTTEKVYLWFKIRQVKNGD